MISNKEKLSQVNFKMPEKDKKKLSNLLCK